MEEVHVTSVITTTRVTRVTTQRYALDEGPTLDVADYDAAYMPHTLIRVDRVTVKTTEGDGSSLLSHRLAIISGKRLDVARRQEVMLALDHTPESRWPQWLRELLEEKAA